MDKPREAPVHHLIEECIIFNMIREECMEALSKHANIEPLITSTVWKELEKENKESFETYSKSREERGSVGSGDKEDFQQPPPSLDQIQTMAFSLPLLARSIRNLELVLDRVTPGKGNIK